LQVQKDGILLQLKGFLDKALKESGKGEKKKKGSAQCFGPIS